MSRTGGICYSGVSFNINGINYTFDGNWFIADKQIFNDTTWVTAKEAAPIINKEVEALKILSFDTFKKAISNQDKGNRMVIVHINEMQPTNITTNDEYKKELAGILSEHPKEILISEANWPGDYFSAIRADEEIDIQDFGELIIISNLSDPMYRKSEFIYGFQSLNYHENNQQKIDELNSILSDVEPLQDNITEKRLELITKTVSDESGQSKSNYRDRLDYLATNRTGLLIEYEERYENLNSRLGLLKEYYQNEMNFFYRLGQNHPVASLYTKEVNAQLDVISSRISDVETGLARIDSIQDSIRNIYYGELGAAVSERAIYESWNMTNQSISEAQTAVNTAHNDAALSILIVVNTLLVTVLLGSLQVLRADRRLLITLMITALTASTIICLVIPTWINQNAFLFSIFLIALVLIAAIIDRNIPLFIILLIILIAAGTKLTVYTVILLLQGTHYPALLCVTSARAGYPSSISIPKLDKYFLRAPSG